MSKVQLKSTEVGFSLQGDIQFSNVLSLRKKGNRFIDCSDMSELTVDLSGVISGDTSSLSLLLRWLFYADQQNKRIHFTSIPESLLKVAKVCGVTQLLGGNSHG